MNLSVTVVSLMINSLKKLYPLHNSFHHLVDQPFQPLQAKVVIFGRLVEMVDQPIQPALTLVDSAETKSTKSTSCFFRTSTN